MVFNGETFTSMKAFKRAYPAYRNYAEDVRDGADTALKLETIIASRAEALRISQRTGQKKWRDMFTKEAKRGAG